MSISPCSSVRSVGTSWARSSASVAAVGWPYGLPAPTEITASLGTDRSSRAAEPGVRGPVVGDLEHVDRAGIHRHRLGLGVAGEQHREVPPLRDEHEAEQVRVLPGLAEQLAGGQSALR